MQLDPEVSETLRTKTRYDVLVLAAYTDLVVTGLYKLRALSVGLIIEAARGGDGSQYRRIGRMGLYKEVISGVASECWPEGERRTITLI
jgi:hypothetical protein